MWKKVKIGHFLTRHKNPILIEDNEVYKRITIKSKHQGVFLRDKKIGAEIGTKKQFTVKKGQFIMSKIDARYGAFGIISKELDDAIITGNFWAYDVDETIINIEYFHQLTNSKNFYDLCEVASSGITHRKYLNETTFLEFEIDLPDIQKQERIVTKIKKQSTKSELLNKELKTQQDLISKLKQSILQEAIEGQLTEDWRAKQQEVEPASLLLERIKAEKARLLKEKKIKKQKALPAIEEEEKPFELPEGWAWCRLGDVFTTITKGSSPKWQGVNYVDAGKGILFITSKNVYNFKLDLSNTTYVEEKFNKVEPRSVLKHGDLLTNIVGASIGRTAIFDLDKASNINQAVCILRADHENLDRTFFLYLMNSGHITNLMFSNQFAPGRANLSMTNIANFPISVPPLEEQIEIVKSLESALNKVNSLEEQVQQSLDDADLLMQVVLQEAFEQKESS